MCDPSIFSIAVSAANVFGEMGAQKQQESAYNDWFKQQETNRTAEDARQEDLRQQATTGQQAGVDALSGTSQTAAQTAEQARLSSYLLGRSPLTGAPNPSPSAALTPSADATILTGAGGMSGQQFGDKEFQADLASKLSAAATAAKQRINALATVSSFGSSFGGLTNYATEALQTAGNAIDEANDKRKGSLAAYGTEQKVDPVHYVYTPI